MDFPAVKWLNPLKVQVRPLLPDQTAFLGFEVPQKNTCIPAISKVVQWLWSSLARTRLPRFELSSQFLQGTHFAIQGLGASHRNTDSQTSDILLYLSKVSKVHRMVVVEPAGKRFQHGSASTLCQAIAEALKINRSLTTINLERNSIGVPGAEAWRRAGRTCGGRIEKCEEQSACKISSVWVTILVGCPRCTQTYRLVLLWVFWKHVAL